MPHFGTLGLTGVRGKPTGTEVQFRPLGLQSSMQKNSGEGYRGMVFTEILLNGVMQATDDSGKRAEQVESGIAY